MSQLDETFSGTKPVADALKFDQSALERWMAEHVEGFKGPLTVEQFKNLRVNKLELAPDRNCAGRRRELSSFRACCSH